MANDTPTPKLVEVNLDGLTYSASPEVAKQLVKLEATNADGASKLDGMKKELDEMKGKYDALKAKYDEEAKKAENKDSEIAEAVTARLALIQQAKKLTANTDGMEAMTQRDIMVKAIAAQCEGFNADGKSDDYLQARFDALLEFQAKGDKLPASIASQNADGVPATPDTKPKTLMDAWEAGLPQNQK